MSQKLKIETAGTSKLKKPREIRAKTENQQKYIDGILNNRLTFCIGPAGTGKTHIAAGVAAKLFREGAVKRIVMLRPAVEAGESIGYLPGDLDDKMLPYLRPALTELSEFFTPQELLTYRRGEIPEIEVASLSHIRGLTFKDSIVVLDEAQNATFAQIWMFITRMGYGSRLVIEGDISQVDIPREYQGGLQHYADLYSDMEGVSVVRFNKNDIVRDPFLKKLMEKAGKV